MIQRIVILGSLFLASMSFAEVTVKVPKLPSLAQLALDQNDDFMIWDRSADAMKRINVGQLDLRWFGGGGGGGGAVWGGIIGTLTDQSDLASALAAKQNTLSLGNLTSGTTGLSVTGGTGAVVGSGTSISIQTASNSQPGLLSSSDHTSYAASAALTTAATSANTNSAIVRRDSGGNIAVTAVTGALVGNADTATALASNPTDCSAGQFATGIAANGNLTCSNPYSGMVESYSGHIETVADKAYTVDHYASYAKQIVNIRVKCTSGSTTLALKIGGTNITTCNGISVSTSDATTTCNTGSTNDLGANGELTLVTSSTSSCTDMVWTIKTTRD